MAFKKFGGQRNFNREMHKGNWTCSDCGKEITELPFEPTPGRPVYCKECWAKKRAERFSK
jgi:CxxC-x17-CxxC domain-containing protein